MTSNQHAALCEQFLQLHHGEEPLLLANAWDAGSARLLEAMGYKALATTSAGAAMRTGRLDYDIDLRTSIDSGAELTAAVDLPVSVDFEDGFGDQPADIAANVARLAQVGVAGFSVEDFTRDNESPIYDIDQAAERVAAAAEAAHAGPARLVLTARTEVLSAKGRGDLNDAVARLQRYQEAGADVLFAPGVRTAADIETVVNAVDLPVSIMALPGVPSVAEMTDLGVRRVSVAAWLTYAAYEGLRLAAAEVLEQGTFGFTEQLGDIRSLATEAFGT